MKKTTEQTIRALLDQFGLEPKEGDLENFGAVLDVYVANLEKLRALDLGDDEIGPTFNPKPRKE
ncbi:MAG TPA: hypothetical protein VHL99_09935 [Candidatus Binatia bacterium]|jgi:hypothetical protein|nr:hypothetical protein [Candidatus Binatia bacterium]